MSVGGGLATEQSDTLALHCESHVLELFAMHQEHGIRQARPPAGRIDLVDAGSAAALSEGAGWRFLSERGNPAGEQKDSETVQAPGQRHCMTFRIGKRSLVARFSARER
jgi:hypothetical protein